MYDHLHNDVARNRRIAWKTWYHMQHRCAHHPACLHIEVDNAWANFEQFYVDMGPRPSDKHSLDRINGALVYSKSTCKWSTLEEQSGNRPGFTIDLLYNGQKTNLKALCRHLNVPYLKVYKAYRLGKSIHQLLGVNSDSVIMV